MNAILRGRAALAVAVVAMAGVTHGDIGAASAALLVEESADKATGTGEGRRALLSWMEGLAEEQRRRASEGLRLFNSDFEPHLPQAPRRSGLGPLFNSRSCESCHNNMGRGRMPSPGRLDAPSALVVQLSELDTEGRVLGPDPIYGPNINPAAINGVAAEARVRLEWEYIAGRYPDGSGYELRRPKLRLTELAYGPLAERTQMSARLAQPLIGLGLLEAIPARDIVAGADPDDRDRDGVAGVPNWLTDRDGQRRLGRFGWKASQATILDQTAAAAHAEMGLTSALQPEPNCTPAQRTCLTLAARTRTPELEAADLDAIVTLQRALAVPRRRGVSSTEVRSGAKLFNRVGCAVCHRPEWRIGTVHDLPHLAGTTIRPFTDLLLHDMGAELADGRPDHEATGRHWRTAPLWGLGYTREVVGDVALLHDGRARSAEEAILWHGGEAEGARRRFMDLPATDRAALLRFLDSL